MYCFSVGNGRAISPIACRMYQLAVDAIQELEAPAPIPAATAVPTEEPVPEPGRPGPDAPEPDSERIAATDRVPTQAEAAIDAEGAIKFRGHTRVDSPAKRLTDTTSKVLNHQWRWDHFHNDDTRVDIARRGGHPWFPHIGIVGAWDYAPGGDVPDIPHLTDVWRALVEYVVELRTGICSPRSRQILKSSVPTYDALYYRRPHSPYLASTWRCQLLGSPTIS